MTPPKKTAEVDPWEAALDEIRKDLDPSVGYMSAPGAPTVSVDVIPTGIWPLDIALAVGGFPRGRIGEFFGPEGCLAGDTFIQYAVNAPDGRRMNCKGGTLMNLYHRFNHIPQGGHGHWQRPVSENAVFTAPSVDEHGVVFHNTIVDVVSVGVKPTFLLTTESGLSIQATSEHRFMLPDGTYEQLENLRVGSKVLVHNQTPRRGRNPRLRRPETTVKHHPVAPLKRVPCNGVDYYYHRVRTSRLVMEAKLNSLSTEAYRDRLNGGDLDGLQFLATDDHVHHLDHDPTNNDPDNLVVLDPAEHNRYHAHESKANLSFMAVPDVVLSIESLGNESVYDIHMAAPHHNFVANGLVVHNSGKTSIALSIIAQAQKMGERAAIIDSEYALDKKWCHSMEVDTDTLLLPQPDTAEQALTIIDKLLPASPAVIVVDSLAGLVPKAILEGEITDQHIASMARLMSKWLSTATGRVKRAGTCLIFINQLREKVGFTGYGSAEYTPGGRALKFYSSVRMDVRRIGSVKHADQIVGSQVRVTIPKNKVGRAYARAEFDILYGQGIDNTGALLDLAVKYDILTKKGGWYYLWGESIGNGKAAVSAALTEKPETLAEIEAAVRKEVAGGS